MGASGDAAAHRAVMVLGPQQGARHEKGHAGLADAFRPGQQPGMVQPPVRMTAWDSRHAAS